MQVGSYQIEAVLGTGSAARVLRARSARHGEVVLRVFTAGARARRDAELAVLRAVRADAVPQVLDQGEHEGELYVATRFVTGTSLRALCAKGSLLAEHAALAMLPAVEALTALHTAGFAHGDVKPEHVLISSDGDVTLIDYGLAFPLAEPPRGRGPSGTLGYVAPELVEGLPPSSAVDVFAVAVMFFELVTGARPFTQSADGRLMGQPAMLADVDPRVPAPLGVMISNALSHAPQERPSAGALAASMRALVEPLGEPRSARRALLTDEPTARAEAASRVSRALVREAERATHEGDSFLATRLLDRALCYTPESEAVLVALERAMNPPRVSAKAKRRAAVCVLAAGLVIGAWFAWRAHVSRRPVVTPVAETRASMTGFEALPSGRIPNATLAQGDARARARLRALDARVRAHPEDREARRRRAALRASLGRLRDAHADLLVLVRTDARDVRALRALVALYDRLGESPRTAPLLERIVAITPRDADALTDLSIAYGYDARGASAIDRAFTIAPRAPRVLARRCSLAVHAGVADATSRCEAARARAPRDPFVLGDLAEARSRVGDTRGALDALIRALRERPDDVAFLRRRAALEQSLGLEAEARVSLEAACRVEPDARCEAQGVAP